MYSKRLEAYRAGYILSWMVGSVLQLYYRGQDGALGLVKARFLEWTFQSGYYHRIGHGFAPVPDHPRRREILHGTGV